LFLGAGIPIKLSIALSFCSSNSSLFETLADYATLVASHTESAIS